MCSLLRSPFSLPQANWYPHIHKASSQIFTNTWLSSVWLPGKQVSRLCCNDQLNIQLSLTTATISGALDTVENHLIVLTWLKAISTIHPTYEKNYIHSDNMQSEENKIKRHNTCSYFTHRQTYTQSSAIENHILSKDPLLEYHLHSLAISTGALQTFSFHHQRK